MLESAVTCEVPWALAGSNVYHCSLDGDGPFDVTDSEHSELNSVRANCTHTLLNVMTVVLWTGDGDRD